MLRVYWDEAAGRARSAVSVEAPGLTLRSALAGAAPQWLPCSGIDVGEIRQALDRVVPRWRDLEVQAEHALAAEDEASDQDDPDAWTNALNEQRAAVDAIVLTEEA